MYNRVNNRAGKPCAHFLHKHTKITTIYRPTINENNQKTSRKVWQNKQKVKLKKKSSRKDFSQRKIKEGIAAKWGKGTETWGSQDHQR